MYYLSLKDQYRHSTNKDQPTKRRPLNGDNSLIPTVLLSPRHTSIMDDGGFMRCWYPSVCLSVCMSVAKRCYNLLLGSGTYRFGPLGDTYYFFVRMVARTTRVVKMEFLWDVEKRWWRRKHFLAPSPTLVALDTALWASRITLTFTATNHENKFVLFYRLCYYASLGTNWC